MYMAKKKTTIFAKKKTAFFLIQKSFLKNQQMKTLTYVIQMSNTIFIHKQTQKCGAVMKQVHFCNLLWKWLISTKNALFNSVNEWRHVYLHRLAWSSFAPQRET